jgi:hypothetical protein
MFWNKKKPTHIDGASEILELASRLGIERRQNVRIRYSPKVNVCKLPRVAFGGIFLPVQDISVGGCCLLDVDDLLGTHIGKEVELEMHWMTAVERVRVKIVSSVHERRHIQFISMRKSRENLLRRLMFSGVRGLSVWRHSPTVDDGPVLVADELWSSFHGDSVTLETDVHLNATIFFCNTKYSVYKNSWPTKNESSPCTKPEIEQLILFLSNIPSPSLGLLKIRDDLLAQVDRSDL